jgi:hypothetical protein
MGTVNRISVFVLALLAGASHAQQDAASAVLVRGSEFRQGIHMSGSQTLHGANQQFVMHMEKDYRFRLQTSGDLPESDGFDGTYSWHLGGSGVPHVSNYSDRDLARMIAYVQAGVWACKDSPIEIVSEKGDDLVIKCKDGKTTANLQLDPKTHTAKVLSCWGPSESERWTFSDYRFAGDQLVPSKIIHESGETKDKTEIEKFSLKMDGEIAYGMPIPSSDGFTFNLNENPNIEVKRMFGYLFVKPKLDGKDEGWWFLDTGAEIMVIDPAVARAHKMKVVGKDSVSGVVASITTNFSKGVKFNLGPVTIENSSYMEFDMKPFSDALGIKLAGICGYDFICRAVLDIDPKKATIGVLPPRLNNLPEGSNWTPFLFHGNIPSLICNFEGDKSGLFSLDTGSGSTVDFFSPCVKKFDLLRDRKVENVMTGGAGGAAESKTGVLDWFQFGPKKFELPIVGFQITTKGGFASPYAEGNIGMGFMAKFRMILDYNASRLVLTESK